MMYIRQMQILVQAQICTWLIVYTKNTEYDIHFIISRIHFHYFIFYLSSLPPISLHPQLNTYCANSSSCFSLYKLKSIVSAWILLFFCCISDRIHMNIPLSLSYHQIHLFPYVPSFLHNVNYVVVFDIGILTRKYENKKEKINVLHN